MSRKSRNAPPGRNGKPRREIAVRREAGIRPAVSAARVRLAVRRTLDRQAFGRDCSVSLMLAGEETLAALNARYRGVDRATDVLSFNLEAVDPETDLFHLGDIAISLPRAARQAAARNEPFEREVLLLAVHGTLHLLGYDHETPDDKKRMWQAQRQILKEVSA
jgi:probable rRNA maturation factor